MSTTDTIHYAKAPDGVHIAYRVSGDGPIDLIEISSGALFSIDATEDQPRWRRFEERLAQFSRLIRFDLRGIGLSDQVHEAPTVDQWVADTLAVLDAAGSTETAVLGASFGGLAAAQLAVTAPDRVTSLILANSFARVRSAPDYPIGFSERFLRRVASAVEPNATDGDDSDIDDSDIDLMAPSISGDAEARRWWTRASHRGASPAMAAAMWEVTITSDIREVIRRLDVPTLVLCSTENPFIPPDFGRWIADNAPSGQLVELSAPDHVVWAVPNDLAVAEIEEFLTGHRRHAVGDRLLAAVMFTDIVDSTRRNAEEGDAAWLDRLSRHDLLVERQLARHSGREIKRMGDGFLAVFASPTGALECAADITRGAGELGVEIRAAIHAAEIEERDQDVFGLGVTIAARVLGHARGGEVITTQTVADLLVGTDFEFEQRGSHELKGVPGEWDLLALRTRPDPR